MPSYLRQGSDTGPIRSDGTARQDALCPQQIGTSGQLSRHNAVAGNIDTCMTALMAFDFADAYGDLNPDDGDYRFYAELAAEIRATRILDLGCGTGTLTRLLAPKAVRQWASILTRRCCGWRCRSRRASRSTGDSVQ